ncbi:MAG: hypothetical protein PF442_10175 [Desulfobulbaceae bacterium]|jgi:hypothetical protein|nr:hypothetical protein [Desulfobulbaceae bacterium]
MMKISSLIANISRLLALATLSLTASASSAWALQTHTGPEGLYVHQGAHIFLSFSLLIFVLNIHRSRLARQRAWRLLSSGAILLILWNIWAFAGHLSAFYMPESSFIMEPGHRTPSLLVTSWQEVLYYLFKMDHLLWLPALLFFYAGLKLLLKEFTAPPQEEGGGDNHDDLATLSALGHRSCWLAGHDRCCPHVPRHCPENFPA